MKAQDDSNGDSNGSNDSMAELQCLRAEQQADARRAWDWERAYERLAGAHNHAVLAQVGQLRTVAGLMWKLTCLRSAFTAYRTRVGDLVDAVRAIQQTEDVEQRAALVDLVATARLPDPGMVDRDTELALYRAVIHKVRAVQEMDDSDASAVVEALDAIKLPV